MNEFSPGLYQHFKGASYYIFSLAKHSETEELMVVYAPAKTPEDFWVRPLSMFNETVETDDGPKHRFEFIRALNHNDLSGKESQIANTKNKQSLFAILKTKLGL